ncbi:MAG: 30S ribosomal protein S4 [Parcubacteria group bacterium]|nr:30S ribosomal protein S4 [Parcubacteria group bacterium]
MARYTGPKEKLERRIGQKLFLKGERSYSPKAAMVKKPYPPGMHGPKGIRRFSEFGAQLSAKQKIKHIYKILEKQFKNYVKEAIESKLNSGDVLVKLLETRLDNIVFRCGFADARDLARQLVSHGHIMVNNKKISIPSFQTKTGDTISIKNDKKNNKYFSSILPTSIKKYDPPKWIKLDKNNLICKIDESPLSEDSGIDPRDLQMIIEYYSR